MDDYVPMSDAMLAAKRSNDLEAIYRLLEQGEDPNAEDEDRGPLLGWAAFRGHTEIVRLLLGKGADVNTRGSEGETPLLNAAFKGHTDVVCLLIEHGADVNLAERGSSTALMYAQGQGHEEVAKALLAAGALEDISEMPEEQQKQRLKLEDYARDIDLARQEFSSRAENQSVAHPWVGAWANIIGPGSGTFVFHGNGTVVGCNFGRTREVAHLEDPGDGTLLYRLLNSKTTKIEKWSVSEDRNRLILDYGGFVATFKRL